MSFLLATRGSNLAMWQADTATGLLRTAHPDWEVAPHVVHSSGDVDLSTELAAFGRTGIFTVEIDLAVLKGDARVGVHSLKDMTTVLHDELCLAGVMARGPVEDVMVGASLDDLPQGATVATGSRRRQAMLLHARPDLEIVGMRGNVETRLSKIAEGHARATVMARAGLMRLGYDEHIAQVLSREHFVPAPGQGIVGLVCKKDDEEARRALFGITDLDAWAAALCERAFLRELEGGCSAPIGGHARVRENTIALHGRVLAPDGSEMMEEHQSGSTDDPEALGVRAARALLDRGAGELLARARD